MDEVLDTNPATDDVSSAAPATEGGKSEIASQLKDALEGNAPETEASSRERLRAEIDATLKKETKTEEKPTTDEQGRARGPDGKFIAKDATEPTEEAEKPAEPEAPDVGTAPAAWKKEIQAKWAELPDWARAEITKREEDVQKGFAKYQNLRTVEPVLDYAGQLAPRFGLQGPQLVQQWAQVQGALLDPKQAPQVIQALAKQYGVLLGATAQPAPAIEKPAETPAADPNAWVDPEVAALKQALEQLQGWKTNLEKQAEEAAQQAQVQAQQQKLSAIDQFASEKGSDGQPLRPHLETVMPDMVASINRVRSTNPNLSDQDVLQQAYDIAVWGNPETRKLVLDAQKASEEAERKAEARKRAQAATRGVVSPASTSPQGPAAFTAPKGSLRDQMAATLEQLTA